MKCNVSIGFECESAETHSCNATIGKGLQVLNNHIMAEHHTTNAMGNRNMVSNLFQGIVANKDIISDLVGVFSPRWAKIVRPTLVLVEKVAKGEPLAPETEKTEETEASEHTEDKDADKDEK